MVDIETAVTWAAYAFVFGGIVSLGAFLWGVDSINRAYRRHGEPGPLP